MKDSTRDHHGPAAHPSAPQPHLDKWAAACLEVGNRMRSESGMAPLDPWRLATDLISGAVSQCAFCKQKIRGTCRGWKDRNGNLTCGESP